MLLAVVTVAAGVADGSGAVGVIRMTFVGSVVCVGSVIAGCRVDGCVVGSEVGFLTNVLQPLANKGMIIKRRQNLRRLGMFI